MTEYDEDQPTSPAPLNERGAAVPPRETKPDSGCMTTPDGDCHGSGCMHNPTPDKRVPAELLAKAVMHAKAPPCSIRTRLTREQAIKILDMITDRDNAWEMAIEAVVGWPDDDESYPTFNDVIEAISAPSDEDAATLAAMNECRELGLSHQYDDEYEWWCVWGGDGQAYGATVLPEALEAYKAAQAPEVEDGWYWARVHGEKEFLPREVKGGWLENYGPVEAFDIRDRLPDRPEGDE